MSGPSAPAVTGRAAALWQAYRLRWKRRRLIGRAIAARSALRPVIDRTKGLPRDAILCCVTLRNEALRLPHFLRHHRRLGVSHFLIVDNGSTDGSADYLAAQPDVSLWSAQTSYRHARFGMDWINLLLFRHGHGRWCLTLDADELLVYPHHETRDLRALTEWLDGTGRISFGAMMLDLYPEGPLGAGSTDPDDDPVRQLPYFDAGNYSLRWQEPLGAVWIQGGPRARAFFAQTPQRAPTLNKVPLVRWNRRFAYLNSTHTLLPPRLNRVYEVTGGACTSGVLLHTKFLPVVAEKAAEDLTRAQHFYDSAAFRDYYDAVLSAPVLKCAASCRYKGWRQLEGLGLMSRGGWI